MARERMYGGERSDEPLIGTAGRAAILLLALGGSVGVLRYTGRKDTSPQRPADIAAPTSEAISVGVAAVTNAPEGAPATPPVQPTPEQLATLAALALQSVIRGEIDGAFDYQQGLCHTLIREAKRMGLGDIDPCVMFPPDSCAIVISANGTNRVYRTMWDLFAAYSPKGGLVAEPGDVMYLARTCQMAQSALDASKR
jgi:hypothetical protein